MNTYKLLTPGPLTTTDTVKEAMMIDHCTWDKDYKEITLKIRRQLLEIAHVSADEYTVVLMQGSGTFGVESVLSSVIGNDEKVLICSNGAYGIRMCQICQREGIPYVHCPQDYDKMPDPVKIEKILAEDPSITHVAAVHSETTTGILNDIQTIARVAKKYGKVVIVDAMSSFGGIDIPMKDWDIDFLISSANKCIQGVPGFCFIICRRDLLLASKGKARTLSLDLFDQWQTMDKDGKWRFTSPTHTVLAFEQALKEFFAEGGVPARSKRYRDNNRLLIAEMKKLGFTPYLRDDCQGPIITTFFYPEGVKFDFDEFYSYIKERGYVIYPGKLTEQKTFRIGNIGEIYREDIEKVVGIIASFLREKAEK